MTSIEPIVRACHARWIRGAEDFAKVPTSKYRERCPRSTTIRSAIYGNMTFDRDEMLFIDSFYVQRLRHVSQMGLLNLVYPDARHSRFEHSLGVLWSLKQLLEADPQIKETLSEDERRTLYFAAILHDCGHGPFSHTTESLLELSGLDKVLRRVATGEKVAKPHERRCRDMIMNTDFHLGNLGEADGGKLRSYGIYDALKTHLGIDPHSVVNIILGTQPSPLLNLLSGDFDVDKMDYFRRDAFFTGTMGGGVDMEAIQRWIRIVRQDGGWATAAYDPRLTGHLIHLLMSREHVYGITAYHPVVRTAAALLLVAGDLALRSLDTDIAALIFSNIELFDDGEFFAVLEAAAADAEGDDGALLRRVLQRIYLRRLPKRLATLTRAEFLQKFEQCISILQGESQTLPQIAYAPISTIANGKYVPLLGDNAGDDLAILELSPSIGNVGNDVEYFEKERETIEGILVGTAEGEPIPLTGWLDTSVGSGTAAAHARALRAYKLSIWRALVLVPASLKLELLEKDLADQFLHDFAVALASPELCRPLGTTRLQWAPTLKLVGDKVQTWRGSMRAGAGASITQKGKK